MGRSIHASAVVEDGAILGDGVRIGPFCHIGKDVRLGEDCRLHAHVVIAGRTNIGPRTQIFPFASVGHPPQDLKYDGEPSTLEVGADNTIREHVTMNPGTRGGGMRTVIGDRNLFMTGAHVAHDCRVGNGCVFANNAALAGHVTVEDRAIIGGLAGVHQFVHIGPLAMVGGVTAVLRDVIPYGLAAGDRGALQGLNWIGLQRAGTGRETRRLLRKAYRRLFGREGTLEERLDAVAAEYGQEPMIRCIVEFMRASLARRRDKDASGRGLCLPEGPEYARDDG